MKRRLRKFLGKTFGKYSHNIVEQYSEDDISIFYHKYGTDKRVLNDLVALVPDKGTMVEIGSLAGFSTRIFANSFEKVISIDPYIAGYDPHDANATDVRLSLARDLFLIRFIDDTKVTQINKTSEDAAGEFEDNSLDFVYIDGDHTYESVKKDIQLWAPKVRKNSYIGGDDYKWSGVARAVSELLPNHTALNKQWIAKVDDFVTD